jgi:uncharacterized membrane protein
MQAILFKNPSATRIYNDYIWRSKRALKILSEKDRQDCLLEINSYIYEHMEASGNTGELEALLDIIDRLGPPEETLKEIVASKKLAQATKTFNPKYLIQALFLNIGNGFAYIILSVLLLFGLCFPLLIILKSLFPKHVGLFMGNDGNIFGMGFISDTSNSVELLRGSFIPLMLLLTLISYCFIVLLMRLIKKTKSLKTTLSMSMS